MPALPASTDFAQVAMSPVTMRIPDACRFTGLGRSTLYLLIARGEIEVVKVGTATLVLSESLRALIDRRRSPRTYAP